MTFNMIFFTFLKNLDQQNSVKDSGISQEIIDQIQRPSVDTLLEELNVRSTSPVYAVPHDEVIHCLNLKLLLLFHEYCGNLKLGSKKVKNIKLG